MSPEKKAVPAPYLSLDLETTGLNPEICQIIEVGGVLETWDRPVEELPGFSFLVRHPAYYVEPVAAMMNAEILTQLYAGAPRAVVPSHVMATIREFLNKHLPAIFDPPEHEKQPRNRIAVAGKNFGSFDVQFLKRLPGYGSTVNFGHRHLDPGTLYYDPFIDDVPPSTEQCFGRAGMGYNPNGKHRAEEDARDVVHLIRKSFEKRAAWSRLEALGVSVE